MSLDFSILPQIEEKIHKIESEYQTTKGLILTEDDLKCLLYKKLHEIDELSKINQTRDPNIYANSIHTEISWFDENNKLKIKPDITILEPENLSILHDCCSHKFPFPSKQFNFVGKAIIFELKFIRYKIGITRATFEKQIFNDYKKIKRLFKRLDYTDEIFCYFVIFNKTNITCEEFRSFLEKKKEGNRYKIIYASGEVTFPK